MYDNAAKTPSPSLLLPSDEQERELVAARQKVAELERKLENAAAAGGTRYAAWLSRASIQRDVDLTAHFTFDGALDKIANAAPGGKGEGKAAGVKSVPGVRGTAVRFDGDRGAEFSEVFSIDRWDEFTLDFHLRDEARNSRPVVVLQHTFGTDVGYNGFDVMLENGILEAKLYRVWPGNGIGVRAERPIANGSWQHVAVTYDGSSRAAGLKLYVDGQPLPTKVLRDQISKSAALMTFGSGQLTLGQRFRDRGFKDGEIDELRIYGRALAPLEIENLHQEGALESAASDPQQQTERLSAYYFSAIDEEARALARELREARHKLVGIEEVIQEMPVMQELPEPRPTYILARGAYDAPKSDANRVERATFEHILMPFPEGAAKNRLGLAEWLTRPEHPLTSRVFVNRMSANFFGHPLVATPENFGRQGATPTHAGLLDWLARDFVDHDWDIKRLCRSIVLSATYQQDSRCSRELRERDPENQLLARGPSRRVSAEQVRDLALAASGLLDRRMGGPPVSPYQAGGDLWRETNTMSPAYQQSTGTDLYRRSLYSVWKRTAPLPNMLAFDATTREVCTVARGRTNTPLQALVLLNDVQFVEAARALAVNVTKENSTLPEQIRKAFLRLTGEHPDSAELETLTALYNEQKRLFADKERQDPAAFVQVGDSPVDAGLDGAHVAALSVTCQAILNLDATIVER
jgi:hypothetical protein